MWVTRWAGIQFKGINVCGQGSVFILQDITWDQRKRSNTYHQLVLGISIFDVFNSLAHIAGSLPIPSYSGIQGAMGNDATCKAAGFFIQLSLTSTYFNLCLSVFFWLTICRAWREPMFRRIRHQTLWSAGVVGAWSRVWWHSSLHVCNQLLPYPTPSFGSKLVPVYFLCSGAALDCHVGQHRLYGFGFARSLSTGAGQCALQHSSVPMDSSRLLEILVVPGGLLPHVPHHVFHLFCGRLFQGELVVYAHISLGAVARLVELWSVFCLSEAVRHSSGLQKHHEQQTRKPCFLGNCG